VVYRDLSDDPQVIRDQALMVFGTYLFAVYGSGVIGGHFADKVLGSRKAIFLGGIVMCAGLFVMWWPSLLFYGLGLVVVGNGFFKPNISTIVSGLYPEGDKRRDAAFTIFYMGINVGAFLAIFGAGYAETLSGTHDWGWNVGFVIAAVVMILSLILFHFGQPWLGSAGFPPGREVTEESRLNATDWRDVLVWSVGMSALVVGLIFLWDIALGPLFAATPGIVKLSLGLLLLVAAGGGFTWINRDNTREEWERVWATLIICVFVIVFWAGFEQASGTMNLFAYEKTDRHIFGWEMPATWFQGFNPLFIILFAPVFSMIWSWSDKKKHGLSMPAKMGVGMLVLGAGFVVMYMGQQVADSEGFAGLQWLVLVYLLHTLGELCLSPIGLSMITKLSPTRRVSLMMGIWFFTAAIADYLAQRLEAIVNYFGIGLWTTLIATSVGAGVVLLVLTPLLKKWMHGRA
jgi:POT family proton-dependent oligopeptide transporter